MEDVEFDVTIRERCVGGFEREKVDIVGGLLDDDGAFGCVVGRCDDCFEGDERSTREES